jgi:hypothetical protein
MYSTETIMEKDVENEFNKPKEETKFIYTNTNKNKLRDFSPQANYTD